MLTQLFDGAVDGAAVTWQSSAATGDPVAVWFAGSGGTATFTTVNPIHGSSSVNVANKAGSHVAVLSLYVPSGNAEFSMQGYVRASAPATGSLAVCSGLSQNNDVSVLIAADGSIRLGHWTGTVGTPAPAGTWPTSGAVRVAVSGNTATGWARTAVFAGESTTPLWQASGTIPGIKAGDTWTQAQFGVVYTETPETVTTVQIDSLRVQVGNGTAAAFMPPEGVAGKSRRVWVREPLAWRNINTGRVATANPGTEIPNSGRGVCQWLGVDPEPAGWAVRDTYERDHLDWRVLEPSPGVYDLARVEEVLSAAADLGGRAGIRVMPYKPGEPKRVPAHIPVQSDGIIPDWNSTAYLNGYVGLMQAIAAQFDNDPRLWFVDSGGYGSRGEWTTENIGTAITQANGEALIRDTIAPFTHTWVMQTWMDPWVDYAVQQSPRVGIRFDAVGKHLWTLDGHSAAFANRWKTAPTVGEHYPTAPDWTAAKMLHNVRNLHFASLSSGNYPTPYAQLTAADQGVFREAQRRLGYRYGLTDLTLPTSAAAGSTVQVATRWSNDGSAPTHDVWQPRLTLTPPSGNTVTYPLGADLRNAVGPDNPVTDTSTVTLTGVTPGTWTVGVTVVDPAGYLAPMRLANESGSTAGVYPVGSITIT